MPAAQESPVHSDTSDAFMSDYSQMLQKVVNIDMIREKAALLQMKGKYVVNEKRLLPLFSCKCPLCGSKVKVEKVTYGVLIILNQQCLQCDYRNQWKSQVNASVPTDDDQPLTRGIDVTAEIQQMVPTDDKHSAVTGVSEVATVSEEESDPTDETEESGNEVEMDSDDDWKPKEELILKNRLTHSDESDEETENEDDYYPPLAFELSQLCTECGKFFNKRKPHTCEHKIKPFSCNICGKRCVTEVSLNSHSRVHDANYEHRCKYCHATFKTKVDKRTHEQTHVTEGRPYKCPDCPEIFATNKERRIHLQDHRGLRQLKCDFCGIEFYRNQALQRHLAVHTGEKPFKCSVCQRGFNQTNHLKSHMRLHTGERPYKCQHCDKCFNHNVSLKSHVQRYHTPNSGCEENTKKTKERESNSSDAVGNGNKRGADSGLDNVEEEEEEEEEVEEDKEEEERIYRANIKRRTTGRPIGRPKRNASQGSNTKTAKVKVRKKKRTCGSDEENEGEPIESDLSFELTEEEEERSDKVTSSTSRSRGRAKRSDSDCDFDPEVSKRKKCSSQNSGKGSGKRRGRPRKNQVVEDT
ncbi:zinc finger and SCAN domain-containing protein 26-like isoform X2 [Larimichthys crocea]|uniref:zinc finger and SCAN domain-containing protein 26-like isoform X2 n=1 Tax=Larimichthys crocea TaxID=215358 RepID=UPI000F5D671D|nr:zinc finger and SCAN domain-containing protein 26-like isoform X2 [Larimichthys crocea]